MKNMTKKEIKETNCKTAKSVRAWFALYTGLLLSLRLWDCLEYTFWDSKDLFIIEMFKEIFSVDPCDKNEALNTESSEWEEMLWIKVLYTLSSVILDFTASKSTACMICTVICGAVNHHSQSALFPIIDIDILLTLNKSRAIFKSLSHLSICDRSLERCRKSVILFPEHDLRISRIWPKTLHYLHQ